MARIVKTEVKQRISALMTTNFIDGSFSEYLLNEGDEVESLRYVENQEVKTISGKIIAINYICNKVTYNSEANPKDYFTDDVRLTRICIDSSEHYYSDIKYVDPKEIVEFSNGENVTSVHVTPKPIIDMTMTYSDDHVEEESLEVGDILKDCIIMTSPGMKDIVGDFKIAAFGYSNNKTLNKITINNMYLVSQTPKVKNTVVKFTSLVDFTEVKNVKVKDTSSLADIATALEDHTEIAVSLAVDVNIPIRDDGKITTLSVPAGKTLNVDLAGHKITTQAYAFYVNGGVLNISDSTGTGKIVTTIPNKAYPAVMVATGGTCNMDSGIIDTSKANVQSQEDVNWMYGVVCSGDGVFNMTGGKLITGSASGISITNGTASGAGAQFTISGDAEITAIDCAAVYLADNKSVTIKNNAVINGGIVARMGVISVEDKAKVIGIKDLEHYRSLGELVTVSGVDACPGGITALTGVYNSALGNDMTINVSKSAYVESTFGNAIEIAQINTKYDQRVDINIDSLDSLHESYKVYTHDELATLATECGKTLGPETNVTDLVIKVDNQIVYPEN